MTSAVWRALPGSRCRPSGGRPPHFYSAAPTLGHGGRPEQEDVPPPVGLAIGPKRPGNPAGGVLGVPGLHPRSDAPLQVRDDLVRDAGIDILAAGRARGRRRLAERVRCTSTLDPPSWPPADDGSACARPAHPSRTAFTGRTRPRDTVVGRTPSRPPTPACDRPLLASAGGRPRNRATMAGSVWRRRSRTPACGCRIPVRRGLTALDIHHGSYL